MANDAQTGRNWWMVLKLAPVQAPISRASVSHSNVAARRHWPTLNYADVAMPVSRREA